MFIGRMNWNNENRTNIEKIMREIVFRKIEIIGRKRSEDRLILPFLQSIIKSVPIRCDSIEIDSILFADRKKKFFYKTVDIRFLRLKIKRVPIRIDSDFEWIARWTRTAATKE